MFERMDPKTLKLWLILAAVVYFVVPFDLFPDFLGLPGRVDDVLIMAWLAWFYRKHVQQFIATGFRQDPADHSADTGSGQGAPPRSQQSKAFDAYEVLGVARSASSDAIQAAYRARMKEYHPDKVAHLGEELQVLAHEKSQQIQRAYRQLRG
jgi:DnaJ like chaperone protein